MIRSLTKVTIGNWNRVRAKRVDNEGSLWLNEGQPVLGVSKVLNCFVVVSLYINFKCEICIENPTILTIFLSFKSHSTVLEKFVLGIISIKF